VCVGGGHATCVFAHLVGIVECATRGDRVNRLAERLCLHLSRHRDDGLNGVVVPRVATHAMTVAHRVAHELWTSECSQTHACARNDMM
jgi:outer membrane lipoprotein SlyB